VSQIGEDGAVIALGGGRGDGGDVDAGSGGRARHAGRVVVMLAARGRAVGHGDLAHGRVMVVVVPNAVGHYG